MPTETEIQNQQQQEQKQAQNNEQAAETPDVLLDKANQAYDAYEAEQDPAKKAELKESAKAAAAKAKETYAAEKKAAKEASDAAAAKAKPPEKYDVKKPENSPLSDAHLESIKSFAKEKKLSNEAAQMLVERESHAVKAYQEQQMADLEVKRNEWLESTKNDKEIGGANFKENAELAKRVIYRFGSESLRAELESTGLGNHPELVRMIAKIGKTMSEDTLAIPGSQTQKPVIKSQAERLYGKTTPTT